MADKTISVEITGDASGLQAAVEQAQNALSSFEGSSKSSTTATEKNTSAIEKNSSAAEVNVSAQKKEAEAAEKHETASESDTKAVEKNTSAVDKNTSAAEEATTAKENEAQSVGKHETASESDTKAVEKNTDAVKKNSTETGKAEKKQKSFAEKASESGKKWKEAGEGIDQITKPLQVAAVAAAAAGVASAKAAIDFEDNFANVKKTVEGTPEQLEAVKQGIIDMTTVGVNGHNAIPQTTAELTELAAAGGQLGITTDNIIEFTEVMAQMGSATNLVGEEGAATIARFMNVMDVSQDQVRNIGSAIVDLGNNSATTEAEIAAMALRMGKYGNTIGMGAAEVLGYSAALSSLGIEAQMGGSAIGRTWLAIESAVASGGDELETFAKYSGKSAKEFSEQWNTDPTGAFNGLLKGLQEAENLTVAMSEIGIDNTQDKQAMMALVNGYDLVTESIERSSKAWEENTALQTEADAKAQTTAGQLTIAKNNITETARSLGEVMLPTIAEVSAGVKGFAQDLNEMSDGSKKAVITAGTVTVGLGALAKGAASAVKTVGTLKDGVGKLSTALPVIAKFGPIAGVAAVGITALAVAGKKIYDTWYDSKFNWGDGFAEQAGKIAESADALEKLNALAQETKDLKLVINSSDSTTEQVETAKKRLSEIAELLNTEYKLNIDTSDADTAADKIEKAIKTITNQERSELITDSRNLITDIYENSGKYSDAVNTLPQMENRLNLLKDERAVYNDILSQMDLLNAKYGDKAMETEEWHEQLDRLEALGLDRQTGYAGLLDTIAAADKEIVQLTGDIKLLSNSRDEFESSYGSAAESLAKVLASDLASDNIEGAQDAIDIFRELGEAVKATGANTDDIARAFATAKQGFTDFDGAVEAGAASAMANDFIAYKKSIGDFGSEAVMQAAAIKNGFTDITAASEKGGEAIASIATDMQKFGMSGADIVNTLNSALKDLNLDGHLELTAEGKINWVTGEIEEPDVPDAKGKEIFEPDFSEIPQNGPNTDGKEIFEPDFTQIPDEGPPIPGTITYTATISGPGASFIGDNRSIFAKPKASGTDYFEGGLAMVNDQKGIPDPRELIVDNGIAYIPSGRDVVLPLSRGAKVYTAKQTKEIMTRLGIPHYASGKDNSDAFTAARDDYSHYTATHAVTTTQELEKWVELSEQFRDNVKDAEDIEEQIYSLTRKQNDELNEISKSYIELQAGFNLWDETGDDPLAAYERVKERNLAELGAGRLTWDEYIDNMEEVGQTLYDTRLSQSQKWLEHEKEYNDLGYDDQVDAIRRMEAYTQDYYDRGLIDYAAYRNNMTELDEQYLVLYKENLEEREQAEQEAREKAVSDYKKSAENYYTIRETFGDWDEVGDSKIRFYTAELANIEKMYREDIMDWQEYMDDSMETYLKLYQSVSEEYDDRLQEYSDQMSEISSKYSDLRSNLQTVWDQEDRSADMDEVNRKLAIYENAVTDEGKQKYQELLEQKKQLERDQELADLEKKEVDELAALQTLYDATEAEKDTVLKSMRAKTFNIFDKADSIAVDTSNIAELAAVTASAMKNAASNTNNVLSQLVTVLNKLSNTKTSSTTYNNNGTYTISSGISETAAIKLINGTIISGLGSYQFGL